MFDNFIDKFMVVFIGACIIALFVALGVELYNESKNDMLFVKKVYIVNQDCKEAK